MRKLYGQKSVEIIEINTCKGHIHMLVSMTPKLSFSRFMRYLKGKNLLMIFDRQIVYRPVYGWVR